MSTQPAGADHIQPDRVSHAVVPAEPPATARGVLACSTVLIAIIVLALSVRLVGIDREPFWLDEVIAHDFSSGSVCEVLEVTASPDVHPPLFHLGLRGWRSMVGSSVAAMRSYSVLWSTLGLVALFLLASDLCRRCSAGVIACLLGAVNPLDVYFAQEARMYAQGAALGALSSWLLLRWMRQSRVSPEARVWPWAVGYWLVATLLVGTHYVAVMVLLGQGLFALVLFVRAKRWRSLSAYLLCALGCVVALSPWLAFVWSVRGGLYGASTAGWTPGAAPVPWEALPLALLRDLLWGHAAFPSTAWWLMTWLSALLLVVVTASVVQAGVPGRARRCGPWAAVELVYCAWLVVGPLTLALLTSRAFLPVLERPQFCLFVLSPFLALTAAAVVSVPGRWARLGLLGALAAVMLAATISQAQAIQKPGLAAFASLWREQGPPDHVLLYPRWNRRVAGFYLGEPVLNVPKRAQLEKSLRRGGPRRVWVVRRVGHIMAGEPEEERELLQWVLSLGPQRQLALVDDVEVTEIQAQPLPPLFPRLSPGVPLRFDETSADPYLPAGWYRAEKGFRWSRGTRAEVLFALDPPAASELRLEMFCFRRQRITVTLNGHVLETFECSQRASHLRRFAIPPGIARPQNRLGFDLPDAVSPEAVGESGDARKLALGVGWLEVD